MSFSIVEKCVGLKCWFITNVRYSVDLDIIAANITQTSCYGITFTQYLQWTQTHWHTHVYMFYWLESESRRLRQCNESETMSSKWNLPSVLSPGLEVNLATSTILTANCCPLPRCIHRFTILNGPLQQRKTIIVVLQFSCLISSLVFILIAYN